MANPSKDRQLVLEMSAERKAAQKAREARGMDLYAQGLTRIQIAERLGVSVQTVKVWRRAWGPVPRAK